MSYQVNALGQRIQKMGAGQFAYNSSDVLAPSTGLSPQAVTLAYNARYVYDEQGRLLGEYSPDGKLIQETIWFDDLPVATIRPKGASNQLPLGIAGVGKGTANNAGANSVANPVNVEVFYLHPDHLGTPRVATRSVEAGGATSGPNAINKAVWMWDSDPFGSSIGNSKPNENPQGVTGTASQVTAASFRVNNRFPGQLADAESGKYYNYFRDYDPAIGRYTESDPIGLRAGLNTFGYVRGKPHMRSDRRGLSPEEPPPPPDDYCTGLNTLECAAKNFCGFLAVKNQGYGADNRADAMRHCIWSCCMARLIGVRMAENVGTQHEERGDGLPASNRMDLCNNKHGRNCGSSWSGGACETCCDRAPLSNSPSETCRDGVCK